MDELTTAQRKAPRAPGSVDLSPAFWGLIFFVTIFLIAFGTLATHLDSAYQSEQRILREEQKKKQMLLLKQQEEYRRRMIEERLNTGRPNQ